MLLIRKPQLDALAVAARDNLVDSIAKGARKHLQALCAPHAPSELRALIRAAVDKALLLGIDESEDLARFAHLVLAHGLDFEKSDDLDWTAPLLESKSLTGAVKMALLFRRLPRRLVPGAAGAKLP